MYYVNIITKYFELVVTGNLKVFFFFWSEDWSNIFIIIIFSRKLTKIYIFFSENNSIFRSVEDFAR